MGAHTNGIQTSNKRQEYHELLQVELLRTRVGASKGDKLCDDVLRKKMGETGLMKTVAHVDDQKRNMRGYCYGRFITAPNTTGKLKDRKIGGPKDLSFGEERSGLVLGIILEKKAECYSSNKIYNNNNNNNNNNNKGSTENSHIRHCAHTSEIAKVKLQNKNRRM